MTALWKKNNETYESSAKVVDGSLIISLPDALNPIVWRMELGSVKASALEVRPHANDGTFILSLKTPKGDVHDIAPFNSRDVAVRALMRVSNALQGASGKMIAPSIPLPGVTTAQDMPSRPALSSGTGSVSLKWLIALVGVIVVIFLFAKMSSMAKQYAMSGSGQTATGAASAPIGDTGVPQSADEMLRGF
jgi:hypothetical protein